DADAEDRAALKGAGRFVFCAHRITTIEADAETVARQCELAALGPHVAPSHRLTVDIERGLADRLALRPGLLANKLHAKRIFARLELVRDELLLRLDAEEIVDVVQLPILDEQAVAAEARAVGEDDAGGVGIGDLDVGDDLVRPAADTDRNSLRDGRCPWIIDITRARLLLAWPLHTEELCRRPVIQRQDEILVGLLEPCLHQ